MHHFPMHMGDYASATQHLSWLEDCAYRRLMDAYYIREEPIPADLGHACRLVRAGSRGERAAVESVLMEFFKLEDDGWHHKRCDEEIAKYREKSEKASRSAKHRWGAMPTDCERNANAMRTLSEGNANQEPRTKNQEKEQDAASPPSSPQEVWNLGVTLLTGQGMKEPTARSFIGSLLREWDEAVVIEALRASASKVDAAAYARAFLRERPKKGEAEKLRLAI